MPFQIEQTPVPLPSTVSSAPLILPATVPRGTRLLFIDNLRVLLICMVVVQHLAVTYGATGFWYYRDPATDQFTAAFLTIWDGVGQAAGMGFFFLISASFTPGSYDRKGAGPFLRDRLIRLGIPLLLYDLLLDPLVVYLASGLPGSYWSFYGGYLLQVRGVTGPVWFIAVLFLFMLLYAALRTLARSRPLVDGKPGGLPGSPAIAGFILALGLASFVVRIWWPVSLVFQPLNLSVGYLPQYLSFYILGLVVARRNWFFALTPRMGKDWSLAALLASLAFAGRVIPNLLVHNHATFSGMVR